MATNVPAGMAPVQPPAGGKFVKLNHQNATKGDFLTGLLVSSEETFSEYKGEKKPVRRFNIKVENAQLSDVKRKDGTIEPQVAEKDSLVTLDAPESRSWTSLYYLTQGIEVGSRVHFVFAGQEPTPSGDMKNVFEVYATPPDKKSEDLKDLPL